MPVLTIKMKGRTKKIAVKQDAVLSDVLLKAGVEFHAPCAGSGICKKCKVRINHETKLACYTKITKDMTVELLEVKEQKAQVLTRVRQKAKEEQRIPAVIKRVAKIPAPTLQDQRDTYTRIREKLHLDELPPDLTVLKGIPPLLKESETKLTAVLFGNRLLSLEEGDASKECLGIAVDIGTTTVAVYLVEMKENNILGCTSALNDQHLYGDNVISRLQYSYEKEGGKEAVRLCISAQLNHLIRELLGRCKRQSKHICAISVVGNPAMLHLFTGMDGKYIALSPFVTTFQDNLAVPARELSLELPNAIALIPGGISAYVGSDILAGVVDCGMALSKEVILYLDIGTNGEMVLGSSEEMYACAAAAGPAFEGAHIECGTGGIEGAVSRVRIRGGKPEYETIGDQQAVGICGSGLLDLVSELLRTGIIDETGLLETGIEKNEMDVYYLNDHIYLTAGDVREVQMAKAAIRAGIETLMHQMNISFDEIHKVYLSGGFGNYLDIHSAVRIGMIPKELEEKAETIGNSAGSGAVRILTDQDAFPMIAALKEPMHYIELSASEYFQEEYIRQMMFENEEQL